MKLNFIAVEEALADEKYQFIDVRSPKEYTEASIPKAINLPILDNQERELIGTIYRDNPCTAKVAGIELVAPKVPDLMSRMTKLIKENKIIIYCWRGGLRSQSLAKACFDYGLEVKVLKGGYKAYRRYVYNYWNRPFQPKIAVLYGLTGVGKTQLLSQLANLEVPTIDFEALANNKGSVFGQAHGGSQPSQKDFETKTFNLCRKFKKDEIVVVECENKRIGNLHIPSTIYQAMNNGYKIHLYAGLESRVRRILSDYAKIEIDFLKEKITLLTRFIGKKKIKEIFNLIDINNIEAVVEILLTDYYDPLYGYADQYDDNFDLSINCTEIAGAAEKLSDFLKILKRRDLGEVRGTSESC